MAAWVFHFDIVALLLCQVVLCGGVGAGFHHRGARRNVSSSVKGVVNSTGLIKVLTKNPQIKMNRYAVNFGAGDGFSSVPMAPTVHDWNGHADPTWALFNDLHFSGLAVEGNPDLLPVLQKNLPAANITKISAWITPFSVVELLKAGNAPIDMDYFKNDIDSYDCTIVATLLRAGYTPKVIHMEVNPEIPYPVSFGVNYSPKYKSNLGAYAFYGCSVTLAAAIAMSSGYEPVGVSPAHDAVFVRKDLLSGMQTMSVPQLQQAQETCCMANHFGELLDRQVLASHASDPAKVLEIMKPAIAAGCAASQGESAPGVCNVPYMASLNPLDWLAQLDQIIAQGPSVQ